LRIVARARYGTHVNKTVHRVGLEHIARKMVRQGQILRSIPGMALNTLESVLVYLSVRLRSRMG
jgi:hypothetical protein